LTDESTRLASGFVQQRDVTTVAAKDVRDVRIAFGPNSETSVAVGPSLALRQEQDDRDFGLG
jgi:hypothetical protein